MFLASEAAHSGRFRRQRLPATTVHQAHAGQTNAVLRDHPTPQQLGIHIYYIAGSDLFPTSYRLPSRILDQLGLGLVETSCGKRRSFLFRYR